MTEPPLLTLERPDGAALAYTAPPRPPAEARMTYVCVHGAGAAWPTWGPQLAALNTEERFVAVAVDLPGHGAAGGAGRTSVEAYAEDVEALLETLAPRRTILCGHSLGGAITQQVVLNRRAQIAGMVLVCTGARIPVAPDLIEATAEHWPANAENLVGACVGPAVGDDVRAEIAAMFQHVSAGTMAGDLRACTRFDVRPRVSTMPLPARIIGGTNDRVVSPTAVRELAAALPRSSLQWAEGAGHFPTLEKPGLVIGVLQELAHALGA